MGGCSSAEKDVDRKVSQKIKKSKHAEKEVRKVLLLGAGGSGKSTIFKQMRLVYGGGYDGSQREAYLPIIRSNMLESIQTLLDESQHANRVLSPEARAASFHIMDIHDAVGLAMTPSEIEQFAKDMQTLWTDPAIQATFAQRGNFPFNEASLSFLERMEEVLKVGYVTTMQDVFLCRVRTSGIVEATFCVDKTFVRIVDVGGQRTERKKWIHCFENVTAVLFMVDTSAYNSVLEEDGRTNCMEEALNLFGDICDCDWFRNSSIILFLNKQDLFRKKVGEVSIKGFFPNFEGEENLETVSTFLEEQFGARLPQSRKIYVHRTNATSTSNFRKVFNAIKEHILVNSLARLGLA
jgi:GTPase SAR1 family protein